MRMAKLRTVRIGELGRVVTGKTPPSSKPELFGGVYPFLTPTDIDGFARYIEPTRFLSAEGRDYQHRLMLPEHSICVVCIGATIGKVCMTSRPSFTNQQINSVVVSKDEHNPFFVYHLLTTLRDELKSNAGGAATPIINKTAFSEIEIDVPPLEEQKRIAGVLSAYDELIENSQRRIQTLEKMARALYREWFVHFKFPGHEKVKIIDGIPEGWEETTIGSLIDIRKGKNITKKTIRPGNVPVVAGGITPAYYHDTSNTEQPVITISASGANAGYVNMYYVDVWASDCSFIDSTTTPYVYYYYLWLQNRHREVTHLQRGAAQPHVYPKDLMRLEALDVSKHILEMFSEKVSPIFLLIKNLTIRIENLRQTRDLLLPRLLSGQIELGDVG